MRQYLRAHLNVDDRNVSSQATLKLHVLRGTHTNRHTRTIKHACCVSRRMFFLRLVDILNFGKKPGEMSSPPRSIWICRHPSSSPPFYLIHSIYFCVLFFFFFFLQECWRLKRIFCSTRDGHNSSSSPIKYPGDSWNVHPSRSSSSPPG